MNDEKDIRDRVIRLEEQFKHLNEKLGDMADEQKDTNAKVTGIHELVLKGTGAAWSFRLIWLGVCGLVGFFGLKLASFFPSIPPR